MLCRPSHALGQLGTETKITGGDPVSWRRGIKHFDDRGFRHNAGHPGIFQIQIL